MSRNRTQAAARAERVPEFLRAVYSGDNSPEGQAKVVKAFQELQDDEDRHQSNAMDDPTGEDPYSWSVAIEQDNRELNRYSNILPYNQTRVLLAPIRNPETGAVVHGDYINASWGPLQRTVVDFWRMVWQEKARVLVMLTDTHERGKAKCNTYWPVHVGDTLTFETAGLQIKLLSEEKALNGEAVVRRMEIIRRPPNLAGLSSNPNSSLLSTRSDEDGHPRPNRPPRRSKDLGPPDRSSLLLKDLRAPAIRLAPPPPRTRLNAHLQQPPPTAGLTESINIPNKRLANEESKGTKLTGSAPTAPPANFMLSKPPPARKVKKTKSPSPIAINTTTNTTTDTTINTTTNTITDTDINNDSGDGAITVDNKNTTAVNVNVTTSDKPTTLMGRSKFKALSMFKNGSTTESTSTTTITTNQSENNDINGRSNKSQATNNLFRGIGDWFQWLTRVNNAQERQEHGANNSAQPPQQLITRSSSLPALGQKISTLTASTDLTSIQETVATTTTTTTTNNNNNNNNNNSNPSEKLVINTNNINNNVNISNDNNPTSLDNTIKPVQLTASQARNRMSAPPASAPLPDFSSVFTHDDVVMSPPPASASVHNAEPDPNMLSPMIVHDQDPTAAIAATAALAAGINNDHDNLSALASSMEEHLGNEPLVQHAIITQIHYLGWPDHGVPEQPDGVLRLIRLVNKEQGASDSSGPVVVHCSAGCGRTGTFCVIDSAIAIITATRDGSVDLVHQLTRHFRTQRCTMVQTSQQYWFCYVAVLRRLLNMLQRNRSMSL
ncbi:protein-tyrosine phosphatase-like protein [Syncephalis fuscata]|nr:protein-tyrosine phosphatase-like protein [Syncephalis fuscata]